MSIGFKEWAVVCEALGDGTQNLLLRKGGIAEGRQGFRFQHEEFFLFPTWFHEQVSHTRLPADTVLPAKVENQISINFFAKVEWAELITDWNKVVRLEPFHIHSNQLVRDRFKYEDIEGINVAFLRVFKLQQSWVFEDLPAFGGCRSWVTLPEAGEITLSPVLSEDAFQHGLAEFRRIID